MKTKINIKITAENLKKLFKENPKLKRKDNILYYEKGGIDKENGI